MPSEYQKWVARAVEPEEPRELTTEEKWKNWLYYHKWQIFGIAAAVICVISFAGSTVRARRTAPDLQIAYIGSIPLPEDTAGRLEGEFAACGEDITGDGTVKARIVQYTVGTDNISLIELAMDLAAGESRFFLMDDPEGFQAAYGPLGYRDGVFAELAQREEPIWYLWADCPALCAWALPQEQLQSLYIGRRGIDAGYEHAAADNAVWEKVLAGVDDGM